MPNVKFKYAEGRRIDITKTQEKKIAKMYKELAEDLKIKSMKLKLFGTNISSQMRATYLNELSDELKKGFEEVSEQIKSDVKTNMFDVATAVVDNNSEWLKKVNIPVSTAYSYVPHDVVESILSGKLYKGKWNYSDAIWTDTKKMSKELDFIVAKSVAMNMNTYDIAKQLEKYVDPSAAKSWDWGKVYPGCRKKIDYNAQRLARTLVSHAFAESFVRTTINNPFFDSYKWLASGTDRMCPICSDRNGKIFKKDELPLDHPNGMCTFVVVMSKSMDEVAEDLKDWVYNTGDATLNSKIDSYMSDVKGQFSLNATQKGKVKLKSTKQIMKAAKIATKKDAERRNKEEIIRKAKEQIDSIPSYDSWIGKMENVTEQHMLNLEGNLDNKLGKDVVKSIHIYTGSDYTEMNSYLRLIAAGKSHEDAIKKSGLSEKGYEHVKKIIEGLNNVQIGEDLILRRGTDLGDLAGIMHGDFSKNIKALDKIVSDNVGSWGEGYDKVAEELNKMFKGTIGEYASFTSTSSLYDRGFRGDVEMIFYAPKETHASSIMTISQYGTSEGETLLNAKTRVKILKVEQSDGHKGSNIRVFAVIIND